MRAVTTEDEQRRLDLFRPLHDHLERLADEDLRLDRDVGILLRHYFGALEVRLAELEQSLVDDVVVELFLLLELEHLRRLIRQHILDVVEDDVVILDVERATDKQRAAAFLGQLERRLHRLVAVGRSIDADHEPAALNRLLVAHDQHVFFDVAQHARDDAAELGERLAAKSVGADGHQVVLTPGRADQAGSRVLVLGDEPTVFAELDVAADLVAAVVTRGAIRIEPDQARQSARATIHLVDDLFVVDAFEQLARERHTGRLAALAELIEEAVGDELQTLFDQLIVDFALFLDLCGRLELGGETGLELAEADIVEAGGVYVIPSDSPAGLATHLDGAVDGPIGVLRVVDRNENLAVHHYLPE